MDIEKVKLLSDHSKHLTTISSAAVVVLVGFAEKIPLVTIGRATIGHAVLFFALSILLAVLGQVILIANHTDKDQEHNSGKTLDGVFMGSWVTFFLGMALLGYVGFRNFSA